MQEKAFWFGQRCAFLANACFALCWFMQWKGDFIRQPDLTSFLVILGWLVAPIWNAVLQTWTLARWMRKKPLNLNRWLLLTNLAFFIFQVAYLFLFTQ